MSKIHEISSSSQLSTLTKNNVFVIVDFYATWCGPCKVIAPVFEQLATSHSAAGKVAFAKVNTDANRDIVSQYGISAMPTFLVLKNGSVSDTIRGANASALRAAVSRASSDSSRAAAPRGANFESKGHRLGDDGSGKTGGAFYRAGASAASGLSGSAGAGGVAGIVSGALRFVALYVTTLFSLNAWAAAESSPFALQKRS